MANKKTIKTVEIADDSVVDLKAKERATAADQSNFTVHKINHPEEEHKPEFEPTPYMEKNFRTPKFEELQQRMENFAEKLERAVIKVAPSENEATSVSAEPKEMIKVKFDKFVQLVASRDFLSVLERNKDQEIIMSSNLLAELAGTVEEKTGEKKTPVIFIIGLAIGVLITYLLISR